MWNSPQYKFVDGHSTTLKLRLQNYAYICIPHICQNNCTYELLLIENKTSKIDVCSDINILVLKYTGFLIDISLQVDQQRNHRCFIVNLIHRYSLSFFFRNKILLVKMFVGHICAIFLYLFVIEKVICRKLNVDNSSVYWLTKKKHNFFIFDKSFRGNWLFNSGWISWTLCIDRRMSINTFNFNECNQTAAIQCCRHFKNSSLWLRNGHGK